MLSVALKEWAVVTELMLEGSLTLLLRKGGIHESGGPGVFELEYERFLLFPSWLHQKPEMVKPAFRNRVTTYGQEPETITFAAWGEAARIWRVPSREAFDQLDDLHPWMPAQIDMRFSYRPENPIYLMAVRVHRLPTPKSIANAPAYGGCRSWVPLAPADEVDESNSQPVMDQASFDVLLSRVGAAMRTG